MAAVLPTLETHSVRQSIYLSRKVRDKDERRARRHCRCRPDCGLDLGHTIILSLWLEKSLISKKRLWRDPDAEHGLIEGSDNMRWQRNVFC
ncbi:hypothetical protein N7454_006050 [Penicillium verhagenii]|nr:hypothetical protein N7454_006050 [Penicillium verhagenii]